MQTSDSSSKAAERRQNPRTKLAEIAYIGMGPENGGLVLDVSEGGLSFHSVAPIQRDEKVQFLLSLRGHSRIEGTGEVVWTNNIGTVCGLKFTSLSPGALEHLNNWKAQSNTSAPPRAKIVPPPQPVVAAAPVAAKSSAVDSVLNLGSAEPIFAIPPAAERNPSVHITEVRGQSPLFWMAVGALTTAFASVAFFYGERVGQAHNTRPPAVVQVSDANATPNPAPNSPAPLTQNPVEPQVAQSIAPSTSTSTNPVPAHELVNASKTEGITSNNPMVPSAGGPSPARVSAAVPTASPSLAITKEPNEAAKPFHVSDTNPRLSPDDGKSEYAAAMAELNGDNGKRDTAAAIRLLQIAAKKGDVLAEVTLADLYIYGDGIAQDCVQGKSLLAEAAKNGSLQAKVKLEEITAEGCPQ